MEKSVQTTLCKGLRACGLPKAATLHILNTIVKWDKENGPEWTVERLKGYKQWYETCLAGKPEPPPYYRKTCQGYPTGVFGQLFRVKNQAKVLAVLSASTVFIENRVISPKQREKFLSALKGTPGQHRTVTIRDKETLGIFAERLRRESLRKGVCHVPRVFPDVTPVTPDDMTGVIIPLSDGTVIRMPEDDRLPQAGIALIQSWRSVPQAVLDYLDRLDHLDWIPESLSDIPYTPRKRVKGNPVGRIGLIQEPALKLRSVANPNRVAQKFTEPLAIFWNEIMKTLPSDCTFDQERGVNWVQGKLTDGVELSGSDLSSATDLLDLGCCLQLAAILSGPYLRESGDSLWRYQEAVAYFEDLSRGTWITPAKSGMGLVRWEQGQPLGLYPSFRLLALTNNALGVLAAMNNGLDPEDSFRVIGDDIIMDSRMAATYTELVEAIGGKVNHSKTLTSDRVAEFAGRVITSTRVMMKTYKFKLPSDDSFMQYVSDLGPQAVGLLANRQRKVWEDFKFVPGIVYDGPWNKESLGLPLVERVAWTESTPLVDQVPDPDKPTHSLEQTLIRSTRELADQEHTTPREIESDLPWPVDEDIQSSLITGQPKPSGDPRRKDGVSTLERLEKIRKDPSFKSFEQFESHRRDRTSEGDPTHPSSDSPETRGESTREGEVTVDGAKPDDGPTAERLEESSKPQQEPPKGPLNSTTPPREARRLPTLTPELAEYAEQLRDCSIPPAKQVEDEKDE